jgi:hypothetical protein
MVFEHDVTLLVMVTHLVEKGKVRHIDTDS